MEREDTDPWYRQFWPWFIIALPTFAVVAGFYTLWLALQSQDSLVVRSDDGVNVVTEQNLAAEQEAVRLGLVAKVDIHLETGAVVVKLSSLPGVDLPASLQLQNASSDNGVTRFTNRSDSRHAKQRRRTHLGRSFHQAAGRSLLRHVIVRHRLAFIGRMVRAVTIQTRPGRSAGQWPALTPAFTARCPILAAAI